MNEAARTRMKAFREMELILAKADKEDRNLTEAEKADYTNLEAKFDRETRRIELERDVRESERAEVEEDEVQNRAVLTPEQRMSDWTRERRDPADREWLEEVDIGRIVRARITGESHFLNEYERRAMSEGTDSAGGFLVPDELSSRIIDRARAASVVFRAGALTAPMASDTLHLARLLTGNTAGWKSENAAVTASDQVWERVELKAKTVVVLQIMSAELFEDMTSQADDAIRNEIAQAIALKLDFAALAGSGTPPEPRGIKNTTGVNEISMGTNGLKPASYDDLVKLRSASRKANSPEVSAFVMHPRDEETYALLKTGITNDNTPLRKPPAIETVEFMTTTQLSITETQGTSTDASTIYTGPFSDMIIGVRPTLTLRFQVLKERYADALQVAFLAWLRADVALAHPAFFSRLIGVRP